MNRHANYEQFGERRLLYYALESSGEGYLGDVNRTYLREPWKNGDILDQVTGSVMALASAILEGPDRIWSKVTGEEYQAPKGIAGRTRRDVGLLFDNVRGGHPLRALGDAWRLIFSDVPLDTGDAVLGFHKNTAHSLQSAHIQKNRTQIAQEIQTAMGA